MICSILTATLFFFGTRYGGTVNDQALKTYQNDFVKSALKTIVYSSSPRITGQELSSSQEIDYLIARVKEDFARNGIVTDSSDDLRNNVEAILRPFVGAFDYMLYIYVPERNHFAFMQIHRSVYALRDPAQPRGALVSRSDEILQCRPTGVTVLSRGLCNTTPGAAYPVYNYAITSREACEDPAVGGYWEINLPTDDSDAISQLVQSVGKTFQASATIELFVDDPNAALNRNFSDGLDRVPARVVLILWSPTNVDSAILNRLACQCDVRQESTGTANPNEPPLVAWQSCAGQLPSN